mmetsp:Transcript_39156/g.77197  ORF Transcript_39156/g.77197 Transcript_39156/m.77197 type:complete len:476 (+) Transcript_39156:68-1495(+)
MAKLWWALVAIIFVETTAFFSQLPRKPTWALKVADEPAQSLNEQDEAVEKQWRSLEYAMESAAKNDDFDKAQECSRQLFSLQLDSAAAVLAVNTAFYRAFTDRDLDSMASLWWDDASVTCSHPGQPPLVGYRSVFETWAGMLSWDGSLPGGKQAAAEAGGKTAAVGIPLEVSPVQVQCNVRGVSAVVSCLEQVKSTATGKSLGQTMHATNVFRKVGNQWLMVHHQASAVPQAGGQGSSKQVSKQSLLDAVNRLRQKKKRLGEDGEDETGVRVRKFQSDGKGGVVETTSELQGEEEEEDEDEDGVELEFILGDGTEEKDEEDEEEIELFLRGLGEKDDNESGEEGDDDDDDEDGANAEDANDDADADDADGMPPAVSVKEALSDRVPPRPPVASYSARLIPFAAASLLSLLLSTSRPTLRATSGLLSASFCSLVVLRVLSKALFLACAGNNSSASYSARLIPFFFASLVLLLSFFL